MSTRGFIEYIMLAASSNHNQEDLPSEHYTPDNVRKVEVH